MEMTIEDKTIKQLSNSVKVLQKANSEIAGAYDKLESDYKARLKADMVAMLTEIQLEIEEKGTDLCDDGWYLTYNDLIQEKINALKGEV